MSPKWIGAFVMPVLACSCATARDERSSQEIVFQNILGQQIVIDDHTMTIGETKLAAADCSDETYYCRRFGSQVVIIAPRACRLLYDVFLAEMVSQGNKAQFDAPVPHRDGGAYSTRLGMSLVYLVDSRNGVESIVYWPEGDAANRAARNELSPTKRDSLTYYHTDGPPLMRCAS